MDAVPRAAHVKIDDALERRVQQRQRHPVVGQCEVPRHGVEEPERRVRRVIEAFLLPLGEHVRDQAVADVVRGRSQDVPSLDVAARRERQPFEADHRVAAPVGEPVVSGDDRAYFVSVRVGARGFIRASGRRDDELIGGEHELPANAFARVGRCLREQPLTAAPFRVETPLRLEHVHRLDRLG